jgi:hypothetical protein
MHPDDELLLATPNNNSPPVPPWTKCVVRGMVGYDDFKEKLYLEAKRDRAASKPDADPETVRLALIAKLHAQFRFINVKGIAERIIPWDLARFKQEVAAAQLRFLKEIKENRK